MQFSPHDPAHAPKRFIALSLKICTATGPRLRPNIAKTSTDHRQLTKFLLKRHGLDQSVDPRSENVLRHRNAALALLVNFSVSPYKSGSHGQPILS